LICPTRLRRSSTHGAETAQPARPDPIYRGSQSCLRGSGSQAPADVEDDLASTRWTWDSSRVTDQGRAAAGGLTKRKPISWTVGYCDQPLTLSRTASFGRARKSIPIASVGRWLLRVIDKETALPLLWFATIQDIKSKQDLADLAPKDRFISAKSRDDRKCVPWCLCSFET
jgi:hypothetical protein